MIQSQAQQRAPLDNFPQAYSSLSGIKRICSFARIFYMQIMLLYNWVQGQSPNRGSGDKVLQKLKHF